MNPSPFTVSPNTHVSQVFNLFRTMGLRHLPVVNAVGEVSDLGGDQGGSLTASALSTHPVSCLLHQSSRGRPVIYPPLLHCLLLSQLEGFLPSL